MRFLLVGNVTPAVGAALVRHGHTPVTPESLGLDPAGPKDEILKAALKAQLEILTAESDLAEAPYKFDFRMGARCMVYLQLPGGDVEQDDAIDRLFARYKRLSPKRLYTVTENRVKIRQLPGV